jgi:hypothetical protein
VGASRTGRFSATALEAVLVAAIVGVAILGVIRPAIGPAGLGLGSGPVFGRLPSLEVTLDAAAVEITTQSDLPVAVGTFEYGDGMEFLIPTGTRVYLLNPSVTQRLGLAAAPVLAGLLAVAVLSLLLAITRTLRRGDPFIGANAHRLYLIAGLGIAVAAEVFRQGAQLRREVEGLV